MFVYLLNPKLYKQNSQLVDFENPWGLPSHLSSYVWNALSLFYLH